MCKTCHAEKRSTIRDSAKVIPEEKKCSRCSETKPASGFHFNTYSLDGLCSQCKACFQLYYKDNKEFYRLRKIAYRQTNRDKIYEKERDRRLANPERYREYAQRRLNLKRGLEYDPEITVGSLREERGDDCAYCGVQLNFSPKEKGDPYDPSWATVDHIVPVTKGGGWVSDNLTLCCARCNVSKGDRDLAEWLASRSM